MKPFKSKLSGEQYFNHQKFEGDLKKHAVKGAGATLISSIFNFLIQTIGFIILARLLMPEDFGLVAMVTSIYAFFQLIRNMGLTEATIQEKEINHQIISTLFWVNAAFAILLTLAFMVFGPIISWFYDEPRIKSIAIILSLDLLFGGLTTQHRALLIKNFHFYKNAAIGIQATIVAFGIAIYLALHGWGYWAIVLRWVIFSFVEMISAWIFCRWLPGLPSHNTRILPMIKFGVNMIGNFLVSYFSRNIDKVLIGWRYGSVSLGYYDRAYNLFQAPAQRISRPIFNVAVVTLSKLRENPEKYRRYYLNAISIIGFVGFPISAILTVMSKDIILLLLGSQWESAAPYLSVFSLSIGIQMIYFTYPWLHISLGRSNKLLRWNIIATVITILSFIVGLKFGPIGVVVGYTASVYILIFPSLWYAGREIDIKVLSVIKVTWKYYLSSICAGLFYLYVLHSIDFTSKIIVQLDLFTKCFVSTLICIVSYIVFIIIMFQSTKPISEFISVGMEMIPRRTKK